MAGRTEEIERSGDQPAVEIDIENDNQRPTLELVVPYMDTKGQEVVDLYETSGRQAMEWQKRMLYDLCAVNEDGLWTHQKFGYSIPRRNGKNEVLTAREMWGLMHGEKIMHSAHRAQTSTAAFERLGRLLDEAHISHRDNSTRGQEKITVKDTGGVVHFRTRTGKGGLGEGFDLLVVDEAQEYQDDQETALKYTVSDSQNPQTIMTGTPPTPVSSGTVFQKYRKAVMSGETQDSAWEEWGVTEETDVHDKEAWKRMNPSWGKILNERKVVAEIGDDPVDFNIQRLGLWIRYNQKSAISPQEWEELTAKGKPGLTGKMYVGIKYGLRGESAAMSIAVRMADENVFVECYDCRSIRDGDDWILDFLLATKPAVGRIVIDGKSGQTILADELKQAKIRNTVLPTVNEVINANARFEQGLYSQNIRHGEQPSVTQIVSNCEKRAIGSAGGFGYRSTNDLIDVSILDSIILAHWACLEGKDSGRAQKVYY